MAMDRKTQGAASGAMSGAATGAMVGGPWGALGGAIIGGVLGANGPDDGMDSYEKALQLMQQVQDPMFDPKDLTPDQIPLVQKYFPKLYKVIEQTNPVLVQESQKLIQTQNEALAKLQERANNQGMDLQSKAQLQEVTDTANRRTSSNRQAIEDSYRSRGVGGGAMEMAQALEAQKNSANQASDQALQVAAGLDDRSIDALSRYSQLAGQMRSQDTATKQNNADTQNRFAMDKWQNLQRIANMNTESLNNAQMSNLQNEQNMKIANTNIANQGKQWRTKAIMDKANFRLAKAGGQAQAYNTMGQAQDANAAAWQNNINSLANLGMAYSMGQSKNAGNQNMTVNGNTAKMNKYAPGVQAGMMENEDMAEILRRNGYGDY